MVAFTKETVVDARGHLLGRLASILAKELLNGQRVTVVRCEGINISGSLYRNKIKWAEFKRKRTNSNPKHGPFHYRAPSKMFWRTLRGMMPYKTARGAAAMDRLKTFDGMPHPFDKKKKMVVPQALKVLRLKPQRKFCKLGDLAKESGWKFAGLIDRLETQRKVKSDSYFQKKKAKAKVTKNALKTVKLDGGEKAILEKYGY